MHFRFDPSQGRFTVQAIATGLLSFLGHSPTFAVRDFAGTVSINGSPERGLQLEATVRVSGLTVIDEVKPADRQEIEAMMHRDMRDTAKYPEVVYRASAAAAEAVAQGRYRLRINGRLSLHGVPREHEVGAELLVFGDGVRMRGASALRLSDCRIKPVSAVGGTIRQKDELQVAFDIAGLPEGP
jgi:polyisoprenoid-binding protein YceI